MDNGKPKQPPAVVITMTDGKVVIQTNLQDPLAVSMWLGMAVMEHARTMGHIRAAQAKHAVCGPDGMPAILPG